MRDAALKPIRAHEAASPWLRSFALDDMKVLVICRGPVRREAFEVFDRVGIKAYGMLLSEKDSVVYPRCLAPELRDFRFPQNVHRVEDYMGVGQEQKQARSAEIVALAKRHGYTHIFAGYGFMAEDADFVARVEEAGLGFVGPSSAVIRRAGAKDEAKKLARALGVAVIPGVDDVTARSLLRQAGDARSLRRLAKKHGLAFEWDDALPPAENAEALLQAGYARSVELLSVGELQSEAETQCAELWSAHPDGPLRFKHIGGGGGKGQRVVRKADEVAAAVMDVLAESKALAPGSNRNFLIERNLESTRHNEIQLLGNGDWCVSLGGRDCSLQMHEQKLLEVSLTDELLEAEAARAEGQAREVLTQGRETLRKMEAEAARFGEATKLNSVSTFECVVENFDHYFMEMNTRIQVEHGVTELVYRLRFRNPDAPDECFYSDELIETMLLLARHGARLPKPERAPRANSGLELRINATNEALEPHAGGVIRGWSKPLPAETRFDQGIGLRNPDTKSFIWYNLAGAYDSNIALLLCDGATRFENYQQMAEILRRTELRGDDLHTNLEVHYGLVQWFLGHGVMAEPDTHFMGKWLVAVGALQRVANDLDLDLAWETLATKLADPDARSTLEAKKTLLLRPLRKVLGNAHRLAGFLGRSEGELWRARGDAIEFVANPVQMLERLYHFCDLEERPGTPPSEKIWDHDREILESALAFYVEVKSRTGVERALELDALFAGRPNAELLRGALERWPACVAAHRGYQLGLDLLLLPARVGLRSRFLNIGVDAALRPHFPEKFTSDPVFARACTRALAPPPPAASDEIVTPLGGTFYSREAPGLPVLASKGDHFEAGQPLFIIEVMKMFNKVMAPFAGTVVENLMADADGAVVKKGQTIFRVEPDERAEPESPATRTARRRETTLALLG